MEEKNIGQKPFRGYLFGDFKVNRTIQSTSRGLVSGWSIDDPSKGFVSISESQLPKPEVKTISSKYGKEFSSVDLVFRPTEGGSAFGLNGKGINSISLEVKPFIKNDAPDQDLMEASKLLLWRISSLEQGAVSIKLPEYNLKSTGKPHLSSEIYTTEQKAGALIFNAINTFDKEYYTKLTDNKNGSAIVSEISVLSLNNQHDNNLVTIRTIKTNNKTGLTTEVLSIISQPRDRVDELKITLQELSIDDRTLDDAIIKLRERRKYRGRMHESKTRIPEEDLGILPALETISEIVAPHAEVDTRIKI